MLRVQASDVNTQEPQGILSKVCPCIFAEGVGLIGRPIRIPKETYAVPGTAVEIVATCKYDVTEEQVSPAPSQSYYYKF